jgi:hypothetical protein
MTSAYPHDTCGRSSLGSQYPSGGAITMGMVIFFGKFLKIPRLSLERNERS